MMIFDWLIYTLGLLAARVRAARTRLLRRLRGGR